MQQLILNLSNTYLVTENFKYLSEGMKYLPFSLKELKLILQSNNIGGNVDNKE